MNLIRNLLTGLLLTLLTTYSQVKDLGTIYEKKALGWSYEFLDGPPEATRFRVWIARTNDLAPGVIYSNTPPRLPFLPLGDVRTLSWPGTNADSGLNGVYAVAVTAVVQTSFTNITGTNLTVKAEDIESDLSEVVQLEFRDGVPLSPSNVHLFQLLQLAATNNLPRLPESVPSLPPIPSAAMLSRRGPEYELSGR